MRFFVGDDNGQLKSVRCTRQKEDWKVEISLLDDGGTQGKIRAVQRLSATRDKVVVGRGDGSTTLYKVEEDANSARVVQRWQETRSKSGEKYVGLDVTSNNRIVSCTDTGHLRLTDVAEDRTVCSQTTTLPTRLCDWILSDDSGSFAYGGEEVEVSLWDLSRAFNTSRRLLPNIAMGKRRRKENKSALIDGEIWRAKNVNNDFLNLRQPVHNTSLAYIHPSSGETGSSHHILAGTRIGSLRRYDTRAARKPVADWNDIGKVGGIQKVQCGNFEYEAFIADYGSNLVALDLRTGRILYAYNGLAGAICSLTPTMPSLSPPLLASTSLDRFFRLHSTCSSVPDNGKANKKGEVLTKVWMKSIATCVVWDRCAFDNSIKEGALGYQDEDDQDLWATMQNVDDDDDNSNGSAVEDEDREENKRRKTQ
ncbi:hypothetical protein K439DRAFT_1644695 [Ramaria rubella]|nr:hypothetical protein K439DRAFT_1644695 [Ramaria rubella]